MIEHTGEKPYKCSHCEKSCVLESVLLAHLVTSHGYDPHKCRQCENAFEINEEALSEYPQNAGYLTWITTIDDSNVDKNAEDDLQAEDDDLLESIIEDKGDLPRPQAIVGESIKRIEIDTMVQEAVHNLSNSIHWPEKGLLPESEFKSGWFRQNFPDLFPDGRGDITCARLGKNVSLSQYIEHLLKLEDRRFANDPLFVMVFFS